MVFENKIKIIGFIVVCAILVTIFSISKYKRSDQPQNTTSNTPHIICYSGTPNALLVESSNPKIENKFFATGRCQTLYTSKIDQPNNSVCYDACAKLWIPYLQSSTKIELPPINNPPPDELSKLLTTFKRTDGTVQYALDGKPLYYYANDTKPGDVSGHGLGSNNWEIVSTK